MRLSSLSGLFAALVLGTALAPVQVQIRIGQPAGFTGALAPGVKENTDGAKLWLDAVDARGGVNGQKVELVAAGAQVVTLSNNASGGFVRLLGEHARGVIVSQVFANERSMAVPVIREAKELVRAKGLAEVTPAMMEGYAAAKGWSRACAAPAPTRRVPACWRR